jgi:hypothetical protein
MAFTQLLFRRKHLRKSEAAKEITLQGDGFATEEGIVADYWEFNSDTAGSVRVYCDNGRQLFRGDGWLSAERVSERARHSPHTWTADTCWRILSHHAIRGTKRLTAQ